jgi:uncharacterized protein (DUF3084 family)
MEEQLETAKKELAVAKEQLVAAKHENDATKHEHAVANEELMVAKEQLLAAKHENVAAKHEHVVTKEKLVVAYAELAQRNEELEILRKKLEESEAMHTEIQQQKRNAPGPDPAHSIRVKTIACSLLLSTSSRSQNEKYLHFGASNLILRVI